MERLSVSQEDVVNEQALEFCATVRYNAGLTGNLQDVRAGRLTVADKQCLSEFMISKAALGTSRLMPHGKGGVGLTFEKLLRLPSSGYDEGVNRFRHCQQQCLDIVRRTLAGGGAQPLILGRFANGTWAGGPVP